jgi:hypothetical protein
LGHAVAAGDGQLTGDGIELDLLDPVVAEGDGLDLAVGVADAALDAQLGAVGGERIARPLGDQGSVVDFDHDAAADVGGAVEGDGTARHGQGDRGGEPWSLGGDGDPQRVGVAQRLVEGEGGGAHH